MALNNMLTKSVIYRLVTAVVLAAVLSAPVAGARQWHRPAASAPVLTVSVALDDGQVDTCGYTWGA